MALILRTRGVWPTVAAAAVLGLSGCSQGGDSAASSDGAAPSSAAAPSAASTAASGGQLEIPANADEETRRAYIMENATAACMRAKGFTYTPHVTDYGADGINAVDGQDYARAKTFREKYGFGIYAGAVYRDDPNVWGSAAYTAKQETGPDDAYLNALTPTQRKAYDQAMGGARVAGGKKEMGPGCSKDAYTKAYGPEKSQAEIDRQTAADQEQDREAHQALDGDPKLVSLAQEFASCLRGEGIPVTTTQPTSIGDMVKFQVSAQMPMDGVLSLDKSTALTKLTREIGLAKKDLACGKDFRAAYFPALAEHPLSGVTG
ncbi:hypothetical protein ACIP98_01115 [Streptomyces sp. NPDC088354]|uniref:hypothetical protein n=1 Tax=unclassified Streptomyces TaxID=2593676 RepID=UPI0029A18AD5|nr:hypothetical protein [Streptomyces sp. MI02-7b]MDX3073454.1 hypothetical protein [Streptomyces sp. MI02-7b]